MSNIEKAKEMWKQGAIEINAVDKNGESLKQYDSIVAHDGCEWRIGCIMYSAIEGNFVAHFEDTWISFENLNEVEKLSEVVAQEVMGWEKIDGHWGKDGRAFHDMPIEQFDPINDAALVADKLNEDDYTLEIKNENGYWYIKLESDLYIEERFGIGVCEAAVNAVREN